MRAGLADYLRAHPHPGGIVVCEERRWIYMKACRTAGTSILRSTLEPRLGGSIVHFKDHPERFGRWLERLNDAALADYFVFTVVREPWDRAVSVASHFKIPVERYVRQYWTIMQEDRTVWTHSLPLYCYCQLPDGRRFADHVARFEDLGAEWPAIATRLGVGGVPLAHTNHSGRPKERLPDEAELKRRVYELYARDVALFGY